MFNPAPELLPLRLFVWRFIKYILGAAVLVTIALGIGVLGYHHFARFGWIDSLLNASMILTGMGPIGPLNTTIAKLFASAYALFSGLVFLTASGVVIAPIFHRLLHKFHLEGQDQD